MQYKINGKIDDFVLRRPWNTADMYMQISVLGKGVDDIREGSGGAFHNRL